MEDIKKVIKKMIDIADTLDDVIQSTSDEYYVYLCFNPNGDYEEFKKLVLEVSNGKRKS